MGAKFNKRHTQTRTSSNHESKRKYCPSRAQKKDESIWIRYKPLFNKLWNEYKWSVLDIQTFVSIKYREYFSARQIQSQMVKWRWKRYKTKKVEGEVSGDEDSTSAASEPVEQPSYPTASNTRCLYSGQPMKTRADAALALGDCHSAFEIYTKLASDAIQIHRFRSTPGDLLIASCFQAAKEPEDLLHAFSLLEAFEADHTQIPELALQIAMFRTYAKHLNDKMGTTVLRHFVREQLNDICWSELSRPFTVADLGTWRLLSQFLYDSGESTNACDTAFLDSQPVKSWARNFGDNDLGRPTALLDCIQWAKERLCHSDGEPLRLPSLVQNMRIDSTNYLWANFFILFTTLLLDALHHQEGLFWWSRCEPETSLPPVIFLSTVCQLILDEPPFDWQPTLPLSMPTNVVPTEDETVILNPNDILNPGSYVAVAAEEAFNRAQGYLWERFLIKLSDQTEADPLNEDMMSYTRLFLNAHFPSDVDVSAGDEEMTGLLQHPISHLHHQAGLFEEEGLNWDEVGFEDEFTDHPEQPLPSNFNMY